MIEIKRNDITVNGKTLAKIEQEMLEPLPTEKLRYNNGLAYFPIEVYEERFLEVIGGRRWFHLLTPHVKISQVNNRYLISVVVRIEILSDDNEIVLVKETSGGSNVILLSDSGEAKSLKSDITSAASEACKNLYKMFGIGVEQLRQLKKSDANRRPEASRHNTSRPEPRADSNSAAQTTREKEFQIVFLSSLNTTSFGFEAEVERVDSGDKKQFVIFKRDIPVIEQHCTMARFVEVYKKGVKLSFVGYENSYYGKQQIVFQRPILKKHE